jgi:hypothetical protein
VADQASAYARDRDRTPWHCLNEESFMSNSSGSSPGALMPPQSWHSESLVMATATLTAPRTSGCGSGIRLDPLRQTLNAILGRPAASVAGTTSVRDPMVSSTVARELIQEAAGDSSSRESVRHCRTDSGSAGFVHGSCVVQAYRASGGVATSHEIVELLRGVESQPASVLAKWIVARRAVTFQCGSQLVLPRFQFDFVDCRVRPEVLAVMAALSHHRDEIEIALWFVQPNTRLDGQMPADVVGLDPSAVQNAAKNSTLMQSDVPRRDALPCS